MKIGYMRVSTKEQSHDINDTAGIGANQPCLNRSVHGQDTDCRLMGTNRKTPPT